jgi:ribonuclease Z
VQADLGACLEIQGPERGGQGGRASRVAIPTGDARGFVVAIREAAWVRVLGSSRRLFGSAPAFCYVQLIRLVLDRLESVHEASSNAVFSRRGIVGIGLVLYRPWLAGQPSPTVCGHLLLEELRIRMASRFGPHLVNDPFGDPAVYVDLKFERRALLFDLGDISVLPPRKLLRISDVFITHRHMDHFVGFDHLLRFVLGRDKVVRFYGPAGLIDAIESKLRAYTWNLVGGYDGHVVLHVTERDADGQLVVAQFSGRTGFARETATGPAHNDNILLDEPGLKVSCLTLDHGIPVLAFALEERAHINIWRNELDRRGLAVGPWLRAFKDAILRGENDDTLIQVGWSREPRGPEALPLGELKKQIMRMTAGRKIAYVVDCSFIEENVRRIVALAEGADLLFIEGGFLEADAAEAALRRHLTASQAGTIARRAGVKRLLTLHYSPRYKDRGSALAAEAEAAFSSSPEQELG